jgi:acetyl-CoA synthetase
VTSIVHIVDPVADTVPGATEIGFAVADQYNASRILFDNLTNGNADRIAIRSPLGTLTYSELARMAARAGNLLLSLGLKRSDRIVLFQNDTPAYVAFIFGAMRAGLVPVLINTLTPPDLLQYYIADSGARVLVSDAVLASQIADDVVKGTSLEAVVIVNGSSSVPSVSQTVCFDSEAAGLPGELAEATTGRDDMAFWMYSSGSTGRPKGIVHLQHDMLYSQMSYARHVLKLKPEDVCFSVPKIFFAYGFGNSLTFPFSVGASSVLFEGRPDTLAILNVIERFRPTVFFGVPTVYTTLANAPEAQQADLSSLRLCISAAEVLAADVFNVWKTLSGLEIVEGLGSTEVLHIYLSNTEEDKRIGAAGRRVPGYEIKLTDLEGKEIEGEEEGVLWVRGQSNAPSYWNRPDKTADTMRGDWIYTGDRFSRDQDGFYYFRGRADDLIKVSGQWVYPLEVELCLADHTGVLEVCVFGLELPDRRMTLKACVVPLMYPDNEDAFKTELQEYVKKKLLPYKYPRIIELFRELPKTGTGKIDRQTLIELPPTKRSSLR